MIFLKKLKKKSVCYFHIIQQIFCQILYIHLMDAPTTIAETNSFQSKKRNEKLPTFNRYLEVKQIDHERWLSTGKGTDPFAHIDANANNRNGIPLNASLRRAIISPGYMSFIREERRNIFRLVITTTNIYGQEELLWVIPDGMFICRCALLDCCSMNPCPFCPAIVARMQQFKTCSIMWSNSELYDGTEYLNFDWFTQIGTNFVSHFDDAGNKIATYQVTEQIGEDGKMEKYMTKSVESCRHEQRCNNQNCKFTHPVGSVVPANTHYNTECKYGESCTNNKCTFKHPVDVKFVTTVAYCRNGPNCLYNKRGDCKFRH
jgi:hypothetical protein